MTSAPKTRRRTRTPPAPPDRQPCTDPTTPDPAVSRNRVTARQQQLQRLDLDRAPKAELGRLTTRPDTRHLTRRRRQVLGVVTRRRRRRRRMQSRHPKDRPGTHCRPLAGTCLNFMGLTERSVITTEDRLQLPSSRESCGEPPLAIRRQLGREGAVASDTSVASR